jgi:hypothetical protein
VIASILEPVTEKLQALIKLQQKTALQSSVLHDLKSWAFVSSSSSKSLLEEIKTHHIGMETTLTVLIAFGCRGSSVAVQAKEELKVKLQSNIEDINHLRDVLTNASTSSLPIMHKVISIDKSGGSSIIKIPIVHHADVYYSHFQKRWQLHHFLANLGI